jgi:hypothetical protein
MAEVAALRPDLSTDDCYRALAALGVTRTEVSLHGRLWTASTAREGRKLVCEGYEPHVALRRLLVRCEALSGGPGGAA